ELQRFDLCALLTALQFRTPPATKRRLLVFPYDLQARRQAIFADVDARDAHLAAKATDAIELLTDAREHERAGHDGACKVFVGERRENCLEWRGFEIDVDVVQVVADAFGGFAGEDDRAFPEVAIECQAVYELRRQDNLAVGPKHASQR